MGDRELQETIKRNSYKILHINAEENWGGGELQTLNLCKELALRGHACILACPSNSMLFKKAREAGLDIKAFKTSGFLGMPAILRLTKIICEEKVDIVHMHTALAHYLGSIASLFSGAKNTLVTRRMDFAIENNFKNLFLYGPGVKRIVAISNAVREAMGNSGIPRSKIKIIYSAINLHDYQPGENRTRESDGMQVGVVANLYERKGVRFLVDAAVDVLRMRPGAKFHIAGDGPLKKDLEDYTAKKGISKSFIFYGHRNDTPNFLNGIDIFVHPALKEGMGVAILEAMAMGKAVVASSTGGIVEVVADGTSGILVPPADPASLAQTILDLMDRPDVASQMGHCGRKRVEEKFTVDKMASEYEKIYTDLMR